MRQIKRTLEAVAHRVFHAQSDDEDDQCFQDQQDCQQNQDLLPVADQRLNIQLHTDGNEEEAKQDVAEWTDVVFYLNTVFGFGKQHTGDECAQCHRQAFKLCQIGHAQSNQQNVDHKEFGRFAFGNQSEPA